MSKKQQLTENMRIRTTLEQRKVIEQIAKNEGVSISDMLRRIILEARANTSGYACQIRRNLVKNELQNRITYMDISKKTKEKLVKELSSID